MNRNEYMPYEGTNMANNEGYVVGRVAAVHKNSFDIIANEDSTKAILKAGIFYNPQRSMVFPTTGDYVLLDDSDDNTYRIIETLPRRTYFSRGTVGKGHVYAEQQAVAANFDYVFITMSTNQNFNVNRLERYITLAWQSGAIPVILLTKIDQTTQIQKYIEEATRVAIGIEIIPTSIISGDGFNRINELLRPGITGVLLGSSGVGKSSIVNHLCNQKIMETNTVREDDKGRHTTTHRQLIVLNNGSMIIDTPGMRALGIVDAEDGIKIGFSDLESLISHCKFTDCTHTNEPGCAIRSALRRGELTYERWEQYLNQKKEMMYNNDRERYLRTKAVKDKEGSIQARAFHKQKKR